MGGGSAVNGMFFDRGSREDYDNWAELGNPGWDFEGLLPYFKKVGIFPGIKNVIANERYRLSPELLQIKSSKRHSTSRGTQIRMEMGQFRHRLPRGCGLDKVYNAQVYSPCFKSNKNQKINGTHSWNWEQALPRSPLVVKHTA